MSLCAESARTANSPAWRNPGLLWAVVTHLSTNAGVRLGCYTPIKTMLGADPEAPSLLRNIAAGSLSGSMAAAASNPMDLVKTQLQAYNSPFRSSSEVIRHLVKTEGVAGLWRGTTPSMVSCFEAGMQACRHGRLSTATFGLHWTLAWKQAGFACG